MQAEFLLATIALLTGAALVWWYLHQKAQKKADAGLLHQAVLLHQKAQTVDAVPLHQKAQSVDPDLLHRMAERLDAAPLRQKAQRVDPRTEHEFNKIFMTTSKEGKEALIQRWTDMKKCSRDEAMRLAVEEWRRENR
jgi:hypothetical protein